MAKDKQDRKDQIIKALSGYLPLRIVEKIKMDPYSSHIEGERRRASILFMDISGFTAISENLDPEEVAATVNGFFTRMHTVIEKYGGDIDKFMGDAMLVLWGTPIAHEDDDERAVLAGMEMMGELKNFNNERPQEIRDKFPISMTMGINSGMVFAGNVGSEKRMEYTVMGDNVNLAARLESMSNPGEIMISGSTAETLTEEILLKDIGKVAVKGKKELVQVYLISGLRSQIGELIEKNLFYMERPNEEYIFEQLYEKSRCILIKGEPGSGKTVFINKNIQAERSFELPSFGKNIPYYLIKMHLNFLLKMSPSDDINEKRKKIQGYIKSNPELLPRLPLLLDIMDIKEGFSGEDKKWRIFAFALELFKKISGDIVIDNLDNLDQMSFEMLSYLFNSEELNGHLILSSRKAEFTGSEELSIPFLAKEETIVYLMKYFNKEFIPDELVDKIFSLSAGNMRNINGLISYLEKKDLIFLEKNGLYLKIPVDKLELPDQFRNVVLAIFDSFDEYTKKFLQYAAIIGNEFSIKFLNSIINYKPGRIEGAIRVLSEEGILQRIDDDLCIFKDENFRESIYTLTLIGKRTQLHEAVGAQLEKEGGSPYLCAYHFVRTSNREKAIEYSLKIIDAAYGDFDFNTALSYAEAGLKFFTDMSDITALKLMLNKARALFKLSYFEAALEVAEKLHGFAENSEDTGILVETNAERAAFLIQLRRYDEALLIIDMMEEGHQIDSHPKIMRNMLINKALIKKVKGELDTAEKLYKEAAKVVDGDEKDIETAYVNLAKLMMEQGNSQEAEKYSRSAIEQADKNKNYAILANSYSVLAELLYGKGEQKAALDLLDKALKLTQEKNLKYFQAAILNNLATIHERAGNYSLAQIYYNKALYLTKVLQEHREIFEFSYNLGRVCCLLNELNIAEEHYMFCFELIERFELPGKSKLSVEYATLLRKMGHSSDFLEFTSRYLKDLKEKDDHVYPFMVLFNFIGHLETTTEIPAKLSERLEKVGNMPAWNDLSVVYDFFAQLKAYLATRDPEALMQLADIFIGQICDPELLSFMFPEIADAAQLRGEEALKKLGSILTDKYSAAYIRHLIKQDIPEDQDLFKQTGLDQLHWYFSRYFEKSRKKGKMICDNQIFKELKIERNNK